jgi:hypothetical protein
MRAPSRPMWLLCFLKQSRHREDSLLICEGIVSVLGRQDDLEVVAVCADLPELLGAIGQLAPHVVVTEVRMPPDLDDEGIRAADQLGTTGAERRPIDARPCRQGRQSVQVQRLTPAQLFASLGDDAMRHRRKPSLRRCRLGNSTT